METVVLKKKYVLAAAAGLCVLVGLCIFFVLSCRAIAVYPQEKFFKINGKKYNVKSEAFIYNGYDYLPAGYYFYSFELHDIYGNVYYTPYITQEIDEEGNVWFYPEDMEDM